MTELKKLRDKMNELENFQEHEFKEKLVDALGEFMISWDKNFHLHTPESKSTGYEGRICHIAGKGNKILKIKENNDNTKGEKSQTSEHYKKLIEELKKTNVFEISANKFEIKHDEQLKIFIDKVKEITCEKA